MAAAAKTTRRAAKPKYTTILKLPALSYEDFTALKDNIAVNGVLVPILVDSDGTRRRIIDGSYRKAIADELGYECPEQVMPDLDESEMRTMCRALNVARRQMTQEQRRELVADQLLESPVRSNRWIAKQLGVHHATVGRVRNELESGGQIIHLPERIGEDGKTQQASKEIRVVPRSVAEKRERTSKATLICGDCRKELKKLPAKSVDCVISDPPYPEIDREYGRLSESDWHDLMHEVVRECLRVLKPTGSAVFILQPNYRKVGQMRLWLWEFLLWAAKEWNLVQDAYWWAVDKAPMAGCKRTTGLMRQSVKLCVWLGSPDRYRNQDRVLWSSSEANSARRRSDIALRRRSNGQVFKNSSFSKANDERGGTTPFNLLPVPLGGEGGHRGHPSPTPYDVAAWWTRYLLPPEGVLLDCFCGSGTMLSAGLDEGAGRVIGIEKSRKYLETARKKVAMG